MSKAWDRPERAGVTEDGDITRFTLTAEHVKLLRQANVSWHWTEWGAPCIDGKRPFGNGDLVRDMAEILEVPTIAVAGDPKAILETDYARLHDLYPELCTALQIILSAGTFEPGEFEADYYRANWRRVGLD
jgi:hypothetical protein